MIVRLVIVSRRLGGLEMATDLTNAELRPVEPPLVFLRPPVGEVVSASPIMVLGGTALVRIFGKDAGHKPFTEHLVRVVRHYIVARVSYFHAEWRGGTSFYERIL